MLLCVREGVRELCECDCMAAVWITILASMLTIEQHARQNKSHIGNRRGLLTYPLLRFCRDGMYMCVDAYVRKGVHACINISPSGVHVRLCVH